MHDAVLATWGNSEFRQLCLWVFEENHRAQRFYAKHGWSQTAESKRSTFAPGPVLVNRPGAREVDPPPRSSEDLWMKLSR
jgi:RimJ/RimL family protein N-acetyltransferase